MGLDKDIWEAVQLYTRLGFDTFPLRPGEKQPLVSVWQFRSPNQLWRNAPAEANVAIRAGGSARVAIIDGDDDQQPGTSQHIQAYLAGLGLSVGDYPLVQSGSGVGRHSYPALIGDLPGSSRRLARTLGEGEFRFGPGAYVAAPPSRLMDGRVYTLVAGDFRQLPEVSLRDVLPLLGRPDTDNGIGGDRAPISRSAFALLNGKGHARYRSRSEAEQALITRLVNAGHSYESVRRLFVKYPCAGKFAELYRQSPKRADEWLKLSYDNALRWTSQNVSAERQAIQALLDWASERAWPGRTGAYDRQILLAHLSIAFMAGHLEYSASARTLGDLAGVPGITASRATRRLIHA